MGLLWGIGGSMCGLCVRYPEVSIGSSVILGLYLFFVALVPAVYYYSNSKEGKVTMADLIGASWGLMVI